MGMEQLLYIRTYVHINQSCTTALCLSGYTVYIPMCTLRRVHLCYARTHLVLVHVCAVCCSAQCEHLQHCVRTYVCVHVEQLIWLGASPVDLTEVTSHCVCVRMCIYAVHECTSPVVVLYQFSSSVMLRIVHTRRHHKQTCTCLQFNVPGAADRSRWQT